MSLAGRRTLPLLCPPRSRGHCTPSPRLAPAPGTRAGPAQQPPALGTRLPGQLRPRGCSGRTGRPPSGPGWVHGEARTRDPTPPRDPRESRCGHSGPWPGCPGVSRTCCCRPCAGEGRAPRRGPSWWVEAGGAVALAAAGHSPCSLTSLGSRSARPTIPWETGPPWARAAQSLHGHAGAAPTHILGLRKGPVPAPAWRPQSPGEGGLTGGLGWGPGEKRKGPVWLRPWGLGEVTHSLSPTPAPTSGHGIRDTASHRESAAVRQLALSPGPGQSCLSPQCPSCPQHQEPVGVPRAQASPL